ncbi:MAG: reactive intermediate/imine deaminase [Patescibacteria group bacterium]|nr:MAG: reactive intermediate/imine deaminase [Patescibacteria group bacterium]
MKKQIKIVNSNNAPKAIGPYSQAVIFDNLIFCSGQIGIDPKTNSLVEGIENQTKQILNNIKNILQEANSSLENVLKTTIFLTDINHFSIVNKIYEDFFKNHKPARSTVTVAKLPKDALIEIEVIAVK